MSENQPPLPQAPPTIAEDIAQLRAKAMILMGKLDWTPHELQIFYNSVVHEHPKLQGFSKPICQLLENQAALVVFFHLQPITSVLNPYILADIVDGITRDGGGLNLALVYGSLEYLTLVSYFSVL